MNNGVERVEVGGAAVSTVGDTCNEMTALPGFLSLAAACRVTCLGGGWLGSGADVIPADVIRLSMPNAAATRHTGMSASNPRPMLNVSQLKTR